jgi:sorbitol-6-phosphate 2-dehydrogenase
MNSTEHARLAVLIRGLSVNAAGCSRTVITELAGERGIPTSALSINIASAIKDGVLDEDAAAKALYEAYAEWEFEISPAGVDATVKQETKKQPSCICISVEDELQVMFWIDRTYDAAKKRQKAGDASLLEEAIPRVTAKKLCVEGADSSRRSGVVKHKIALVTGGAQGFGEEIVRGLIASGAQVFIADLNFEGAQKLAKEINTQQKKTVAFAAAVNVADEQSVEALFKTVEETTGGLDLCVSNAGVLKAASVLEQDLQSFRFVTDINYVGFFLISKYSAMLLRLQNRVAPDWKTDIIQINSKSGLEGSNKNGSYAGAKFGGLGLVASFAKELVEYNIKVNAICPGNFFDGQLWSDPEKGLFVQYLKTGKVPGAKTIADVKAFYEAKVPMGRGCTGPDVMCAIYYIVEQEYETGQAVPVTGGQVMLH